MNVRARVRNRRKLAARVRRFDDFDTVTVEMCFCGEPQTTPSD